MLTDLDLTAIGIFLEGSVFYSISIVHLLLLEFPSVVFSNTMILCFVYINTNN